MRKDVFGKIGRLIDDPVFKLIFTLSIAGSVFTAFIYIGCIYFHLPPNDAAYRTGFGWFLADPFVLTIALTAAVPSGAVLSLPLFWLLHKKRLLIVFPIIQFITAGTIILLGQEDLNLVLAGGCGALLVSALIFKVIPFADAGK